MCSGHGRVVFRYFVLELVFLCPNIFQASIKVIFELYKVILKPFFLKKKKKKKNVGTLLIHPVLGKME